MKKATIPIFSNKEVDLKNKIILNLKNDLKVLKKFHAESALSEEWIRGYILGAETMTGTKLACWDYEDIIKQVLSKV